MNREVGGVIYINRIINVKPPNLTYNMYVYMFVDMYREVNSPPIIVFFIV